ncbi:hypothetical protein [Ammonifex thiophilus]|uniref:Replicative helicase inhibitor G39P N-terminal domain-containing protein n=1 Tax=Ammonifex thiophilus TaxID=444093 RepID=A0A3D8P5U7_9THEO|nr:hypothetical protein [Ammonifex thiophilus]RDV83896.1 hypothetical protein DXX99_03415 [Ammonifex thiophilus]
MTPDEARDLVLLAAANFPTQLRGVNLEPTIYLWSSALSDVPYELAKQALLKVLFTGRHFPTVAEVLEAVVELQWGRPRTPEEAWELVRDAVRRYGTFRWEEAVKSLPPDVAEVVRQIGWVEICTSDKPDVIRSQFFRIWERKARSQAEKAALAAARQDLSFSPLPGGSGPHLPREVAGNGGKTALPGPQNQERGDPVRRG